MATFRNKSIEEWQRKTEVTTGATAIKANCMLLIRSGSIIELNISEQVASYMSDPSKMVRQVPEGDNTTKGDAQCSCEDSKFHGFRDSGRSSFTSLPQ
ncbi:protein AATF-like [Pyrus ussuriensis x Pyrus communis]|uniref:Protein AATF-like n=1 Tax=Pyrus ussuriensis x Pyrus communis TaxID=2448454 RepID=A0A5N5GY96_9ROSA|nr:protein AATF-like [Pyrus ussuriensis x Pyrus communis]